MKAPLFLLTGMIALIAVATAATGCGGGDGDTGLTSEEYFRQVEGLVGDLDQQSEALAIKWEEDLASAGSDEERLGLARDFYGALFSLIGPLRDDLRDIEPPKEAKEAHDALVDLADEFSSVWSDISGDVKNAASEAELGELLTSDEFTAVGQRFEQACFELQRIADDSGIDVDLKCGD
jgi:hypothetical protein